MHGIVVQDAPGYFIFFVPAVILSSLFLAQGSGIWAVLLSATLIKAFLLSPTFTLGFARHEDLWALIVFLTTGLVTALTSEALHEAFFRLAAANARLTASECEKEVLLHDLTHRFKNDLANLTALLRLRARTVADPSAKTELMAASERVHVMGRVHQRLTRVGEAAVVDVRTFISDLCEDLRLTMIGARPIAFWVEVDEGQFPFAQAITLGLVVNELVTNALKYAFPDNRPGMITVRLTRKDNEYQLLVTDNGVGQAAAAPGSTGFGQRLIQSMAQQLGGSYEVQVGDGGRTCLVRFLALGLPGSQRRAAAEGGLGKLARARGYGALLAQRLYDRWHRSADDSGCAGASSGQGRARPGGGRGGPVRAGGGPPQLDAAASRRRG